MRTTALVEAAIVAALTTLGSAVAVAAPVIRQPVTDLAEVLDDAARVSLEQQLGQLRDATGIPMAVLTVSNTGGVSIDEFSRRVAARWPDGTGEREDGIVLTIAPGDHRLHLEVGRGLEPILTRSEIGRILGAAQAHIREQRHAEALASVVAGVAEATSHIRPGEEIPVPLGARLPVAYLVVLSLGFLLGLLWRALPDRARLAGRRWRGPPGAILACGIGPAAVAVVFAIGGGAWLAYSALFLAGVGTAVGVVAVTRRHGLLVALWPFLSLVAGAAAMVAGVEEGLQAPAAIVFGTAWYGVLAGAALTLPMAGIIAIAATVTGRSAVGKRSQAAQDSLWFKGMGPP